MEDFLGRFLTSYVLFPLIAFLLGGVVFLIAKKNKLRGNSWFFFAIRNTTPPSKKAISGNNT